MGDPCSPRPPASWSARSSSGVPVTLAGGTQMATVAALARHAGVEGRLPLATTSFVADDPSADVGALADDLGLTLAATDPAFGESDHPAMAAYARGEAKRGRRDGRRVGALRARRRPAGDVRDRVAALTDRLLAERESPS